MILHPLRLTPDWLEWAHAGMHACPVAVGCHMLQTLTHWPSVSITKTSQDRMVLIEWPTAAAHAGDVMVAVSVHSQLSFFLARYRAGSVDSVFHGCYQQLLHQLKDSVSYKLI